MPHIYLSGLDCTGKSTYAKALEKGGFKYMKWSLPEPGEDRYEKALEAIRCDTPTVFDRGWIGHLIYADVIDQPDPNHDQCMSLIKTMVDNGGYFMYFTGELAVITHRMQARGDDYFDSRKTSELQDKLIIIQEKYDLFVKDLMRAGIPVMLVKFVTPDPHDHHKRIHAA